MAFGLAIALMAAGGTWLLAYSTPYGLGLNDDSIAYIAGARSILNGDGYRAAWLATSSPVTHFPPGFPVALAGIGHFTGLDPIRGARALNGLLFGLNIALTGWLGYRMTGSRGAGVLAAGFTLLSSSLLEIHSRAMSEPLYLSWMLLAFLLLEVFFTRERRPWLAFLGIVLGWAYLTRYAALALLATVLVALWVLHGEWRRGLASTAIVVAGALPWILAWSIRNRIVGGSFTNRVLGWHPITFENWELAVATFAEFLVPVFSWRRQLLEIPGLLEAFLVLVLLLLAVWVVRSSVPRLLHPETEARPQVLAVTAGLYVLVYLSLLAATMTLFDPATRFQVRILSPTYIPLILLAVTAGTWLWRRAGLYPRSILALLVAGCLLALSFGQQRNVGRLQKAGGTFAHEKWADSDAIAAIDSLPDEVLVLSNEPGLVYLYTGRAGGGLPKAPADIAALKPYVLEGDIVLALFRVNSADPYTLEYYYDLGSGLYLTDYSNAWIFSAFPE